MTKMMNRDKVRSSFWSISACQSIAKKMQLDVGFEEEKTGMLSMLGKAIPPGMEAAKEKGWNRRLSESRESGAEGDWRSWEGTWQDRREVTEIRASKAMDRFEYQDEFVLDMGVH